jgi:serine/threonine-protein kinase
MNPTRLGPHELKLKLAVGGYCDIWLARSNGPYGFQRWCALKTPRPEFRGDESQRRSLAAEARLMARMDHPRVVSLMDFGQDQATGELFLTMPYIQGRTLSTLVKRGHDTPLFGTADALLIGADLLDALGHVHALRDEHRNLLNIVHRDVSPENVMIGYDGHVRLIDFGIAISEMVSRHTQVHTVKGKAQYLSPEQANGSPPLDRRSDVFSAGLVMYYMLTGTEPFASDNVFTSIAKARVADVPPAHTIASVPRDVSALVHAMLTRDLNQRPADANDLARKMTTLRQKLYPAFTRAKMRSHIEMLLEEERMEDTGVIASVSGGTQVIRAEPEPEPQPAQRAPDRAPQYTPPVYDAPPPRREVTQAAAPPSPPTPPHALQPTRRPPLREHQSTQPLSNDRPRGIVSDPKTLELGEGVLAEEHDDHRGVPRVTVPEVSLGGASTEEIEDLRRKGESLYDD